jgi:pilus assembly protein CpaD
MRSSIALRSAAGAGPAAVRLLTLSLLALVVAGCKTTGEPGAYVAGWTLIDPAQRHPIMVSEQPATMTTRIPRGSSGLTGPQKEQVAKFLERYRASDAGNSKLVIFVPTGSPNETAAVRAVSDVRQMIGEFGFPESNIAIEPYQEHRDASAPIRLSYLRYVAEAPECGRWTTNLAEDYRNLPHPNFGCATQRNFAAQVSNPADLLGPRTMDPADQERRSVVLDRYRQGRPTSSDRTPDERISVRGN